MKTKTTALILSLAVFLQLFAVFTGNAVSAASNANLTETATLAVVYADSANIYSEASASGEKLRTIAKASSYPCFETVQKDGTTWFKVMYNSAQKGWISSDSAKLVTVSCHQLCSDTSSLIRLVRPKSSVDIRAKADNSSASLGEATASNVFTVINDADDSSGVTWFKVRFGDSEGWISRKSVTITNAYRSIAAKTFSESNIPVIYISPSRQNLNPYPCGNTNESEQMYRVGESIKKILEKTYNCKVYIADKSKDVTKNERPLEAAKLGADIYLAIHSNASPDSSVRYGSEDFYYAGCAQSKTLGTNLVSRLNSISPFSKEYSMIIDGMKYMDNFGYAEVRAPSGYNMISALLEVQYHDNADSADWIIKNIDKIAQAIADGLNDTFKFPKINSTSTTDSAKKLTVTGSAVNVRSTAGTSGKIVATVKKGQSFTYSSVKTVNGKKWYYIKVNSKTSGWICGTYVKLSSAAQTTTATSVTSKNRVKITASSLNVRQTPGTGKIIASVKKNSVYEYTSTQKVNGVTWYKIKVNSKISGWVSGQYAKKC